MTPREARETQRAYVERVLREAGRFATYDALYGLHYESGQKCSITRLAAVIHDLRRDGWIIDTEDERAALAVYRFVAAPRSHAAARVAVPRLPVPEWVERWRCADCGSRPASEPAALLGDLGRAFCLTCGAQRYFRAAA